MVFSQIVFSPLVTTPVTSGLLQTRRWDLFGPWTGSRHSQNIKSENQERGKDEFHGIGGPLSVSDTRIKLDLLEKQLLFMTLFDNFDI